MAIRASANKARATGAQADQGRQEQVLVTIVRILLALALAVPFVVMGGWLTETVYPYVVGKALFFRLVVEAAFAVWLYLLIRYPAYRLPRSWLLVSLMGYMVVALAASFAGVSLTHSLWSNYERMEGWITLGHLTMFALMLASVLRRFRHWQTVLNINLLAGLVVGLLGLFEVAGGEERRLSVTFGNPAFLASYAAVNLFIASAFLSHSLASPGGTGSPDTASASQALMRSFWVAVIGLDLLMLNYSGTRGAMVGLAVGIAMILVAGALWSERRILKMSCAAVLLALVALAAMVLLIRQGTISVNATQASPTLQRFIDLTPESFAVRSRLSSIDVGLEAFTARPVLGWGPENYGTAYDSHVDGEAAAGLFRFDRAHNRIVEELVVAGTIGLAAYAAVWSCLTWLFVTRIRALPLDRRLFTMFIGAGMAAYFVQNLFLFDTPAASVQLYLLLGFALYMGSVSASAVFAPRAGPADHRESRPDSPSSHGKRSDHDGACAICAGGAHLRRVSISVLRRGGRPLCRGQKYLCRPEQIAHRAGTLSRIQRRRLRLALSLKRDGAEVCRRPYRQLGEPLRPRALNGARDCGA